MIAFQTLLLGLLFGTRPVTFMVSPPVKSVEVRLDGTPVGVLEGEPWTIRCDLGKSPHPHELIAIGRNVSGQEIGRVRQWVNMPRPLAEATLLLERGPQPTGALAARLAWNEVKGTEPKSVRVTLDGKLLTIKDPKRFELPSCDFREAHVLSAELVFAEGRTAGTQAVFGGDIGVEEQSELTGVPLVTEAGKNAPTPPALQDWFRDGEAPLRVLGVEQGPADVVLILDQAVQQVLAKERGAKATDLGFSGRPGPAPPLRTFDQAGSSDTRLSIAYGVPDFFNGGDNSVHMVFPALGPMAFVTWDFRARLANMVFGPGMLAKQTLADAVATMGALAAANNRARAVVLLLAGSREDASSITAADARAYLKDLHVPLLVWSLQGGGETDGWGTAEDVSSARRLDQAAKRLRENLAAQHIVWLEGAHLPQRVRLAESVKNAHLAD